MHFIFTDNLWINTFYYGITNLGSFALQYLPAPFLLELTSSTGAFAFPFLPIICRLTHFIMQLLTLVVLHYNICCTTFTQINIKHQSICISFFTHNLQINIFYYAIANLGGFALQNFPAPFLLELTLRYRLENQFCNVIIDPHLLISQGLWF